MESFLILSEGGMRGALGYGWKGLAFMCVFIYINYFVIRF